MMLDCYQGVSTPFARQATPYIVVRCIPDGWGVFKVSLERGQIVAKKLCSYPDRQTAFRSAREEAAWQRVPLMGRDGLEVVPASEVQF